MNFSINKKNEDAELLTSLKEKLPPVPPKGRKRLIK